MTKTSPKKINKSSCTRVAHPYCAIVQNQKNHQKNLFSIIRQTAYENFDAKGDLIHPKLEEKQKHLIANSQQKMTQDMFCRTCYEPNNEKQVQFCFNCVGEEDVEGLNMVCCEKCKIWYH
jgi:hypothetical protein